MKCIPQFYKKCVHMYVNAKMTLVETVPGIGGGVNSSVV
jgi:hypothetical protein